MDVARVCRKLDNIAGIVRTIESSTASVNRELDVVRAVLGRQLADDGAHHVAAEDMPAFRRMLLLLKVQFDAGEISGEPWTANADAFALLTRLCAEYEVA